MSQQTLYGEFELDVRVRESLRIIENTLEQAKTPLIINFSGGKDSLVLLDLVQRVTDNFIPFYMKTDIDFPETLDFVEEACDKELLTSVPSDHLGGFFVRLKKHGYFPTVQSNTLWCNRDLKVRPQHKVLTRKFGKKAVFYKLNGVRKFESSRRQKIHTKPVFIQKDYHVGRSFMVFPMLNWTDDNVANYICKRNIKVTTKPLYKKFGVSGCFWCPFYQAEIYRKVLKEYPSLYDEIIEWEVKLNKPSINGHVWLKDLKEESK